MAIIPTQVHSTLLEPGPEELQDGHGPVARPSERCTRLAVWPARGYVLARRGGAPVWSHLKSTLQRDDYESLTDSQLKNAHSDR